MEFLEAGLPGDRPCRSHVVARDEYDTQAEVPAGFASDPANDVDVLTLGLAYRPTDAIVFKLDYSDFDNGANDAIDRLTLGMGFVF